MQSQEVYRIRLTFELYYQLPPLAQSSLMPSRSPGLGKTLITPNRPAGPFGQTPVGAGLTECDYPERSFDS